MIAVKEQFPHLTPEEYFTWEAKQTDKYEYINGQIYAMSGGTVNHGRIAVRLTTMFETHLENSHCLTGNSDIKIKIIDSHNYTYPDVSVTCDERDKNSPNYFTYPCLIVEVLSDSTEAYDRGKKFRMYRQNPVLQDYLLVSSTRIEIDLYHKNDAGEWIIINYQQGDIIELDSINLSFPVAQIYRNLSFN